MPFDPNSLPPIPASLLPMIPVAKLPVVNSTDAGAMLAADKVKLDALSLVITPGKFGSTSITTPLVTEGHLQSLSDGTTLWTCLDDRRVTAVTVATGATVAGSTYTELPALAADTDFSVLFVLDKTGASTYVLRRLDAGTLAQTHSVTISTGVVTMVPQIAVTTNRVVVAFNDGAWKLSSFTKSTLGAGETVTVTLTGSLTACAGRSNKVYLAGTDQSTHASIYGPYTDTALPSGALSGTSNGITALLPNHLGTMLFGFIGAVGYGTGGSALPMNAKAQLIEASDARTDFESLAVIAANSGAQGVTFVNGKPVAFDGNVQLVFDKTQSATGTFGYKLPVLKLNRDLPVLLGGKTQFYVGLPSTDYVLAIFPSGVTYRNQANTAWVSVPAVAKVAV